MNQNGQVVLHMGGIEIKAILTWLMRVISIVLAAGMLWMAKLILAGVMYLVNTLPPMQAKVNQLVTEVADLKIGQAAAKQEIKVAAETAKQELAAAEERVTNNFAEQLKKERKLYAR